MKRNLQWAIVIQLFIWDSVAFAGLWLFWDWLFWFLGLVEFQGPSGEQAVKVLILPQFFIHPPMNEQFRPALVKLPMIGKDLKAFNLDSRVSFNTLVIPSSGSKLPGVGYYRKWPRTVFARWGFKLWRNSSDTISYSFNYYNTHVWICSRFACSMHWFLCNDTTFYLK